MRLLDYSKVLHALGTEACRYYLRQALKIAADSTTHIKAGALTQPKSYTHRWVVRGYLIGEMRAHKINRLRAPPRFSVSVFAKAYPHQGGWVPEVAKASILSRRLPGSLIILGVLGVGQGTQKKLPCGVVSGTYSQIMCGLCMSWKEFVPECCFQLAL